MSKPTVLFLCTGNSARSQMGEGLLRHEAGDRFEVLSAGTDPKGVNPLSVRAMAELGIDLAGHHSKHVDALRDRQPFDVLIVVCGEADRECPANAVPSKQRLLWKFDDPAAATGSEEDRLATFRRIREQIHGRIREWLEGK